MARITEYDEGELTAQLEQIFPKGERTILGIGDDCAQIATPEGSFIATTDIIVEDEHFRRSQSDPKQIDARTAAQDLVDTAGMGGRTSALVVTVALTPDIELDWLLDLVGGVGERAREAGAGVVGGDLSRGETMVLSITAMGWCKSEPMRRNGVKPDDILAFSGRSGLSNVGLDLLLGGHVDPAFRTRAEFGSLYEPLTTYRAPKPPLESGPVGAKAGVRAMMDLSDGVAKDGGRMARASKVVIELGRRVLEAEAAKLQEFADTCKVNPLKWALSGRENHEILMTFPKDASLPQGSTPIGTLRAPQEGEAPVQLLDGVEVKGDWDHFKTD